MSEEDIAVGARKNKGINRTQIPNPKHQIPNSNYPMTKTKKIPCKVLSFWKLEFGI
jgi:hypothetical protein